MKKNNQVKINILTIFPEMFTPLSESMVGRAREKGLIDINIIDIRLFSKDKHKKVDDYPFGGGQGMVFMMQPVFDALKSVDAERTKNIYMSPRGKVLNATYIKGLAVFLTGDEAGIDDPKKHGKTGLQECDRRNAEKDDLKSGLTILCGHYEGIDQRIIDYWHMEEISIGDYVLTGGELASMVLVDAVVRLIPGVLGEEHSAFDESIYSGLLEYPQYTQPRIYSPENSTSDSELCVPEVLLSGNHKEIDLWRFRESLTLTKKKRPDILKDFLKNHKDMRPEFTKEELKILLEVLNKREIALLEKHLTQEEALSLGKAMEKGKKKKEIR